MSCDKMSSTLSELPVEIFILIRDFLVIVDLRAFIKPEKEGLEKFTEQEAFRSRRNVLSVSNGKERRQIRKETMLWSLNRFASDKFRDKNSFHKRIVDGVRYPQKQVGFNFHLAAVENIVTALAGNNSEVLRCDGYRDITRKLPCSKSIRVLSLSSFDELRELGDYEYLEQLILRFCMNIEQTGEMPKLSSLSLIYSAFPMEFPTESLKVLTIEGIDDFLLHNCRNLPQLEELTFKAILPPDVVKFFFPALKKVKFQILTGCTSVLDISELVSLRHLEILVPTPLAVIRGRNKIYPNLETLVTPYDKFLEENFCLLRNPKRLVVENFPVNHPTIGQYVSIPNFKLISSNGSVVDHRNYCIHLDDKLKSLSLSMGVSKIQISNPQSIFNVYLKNAQITDLTPFKYVEFLQLKDCTQINDLSPLKDIPHLTLIHLPKVTTFSCLGKKQRYLRIVRCIGLHDADIDWFEQVHSLEVNDCQNILGMKGLSKNIQLTVKNCEQLQSISLCGRHIKVSLMNCPLLKCLRLERKIFSLQVSKCPALEYSILFDYHEYFNGRDTFRGVIDSIRISRAEKDVTSSSPNPLLDLGIVVMIVIKFGYAILIVWFLCD
jgi:hypothetical protein